MGFPQGINFRATAGFVTDPTNTDHEIGTTANYPRTSAQGNTVGWEDSPGANTRDRSAFTGNSAKVAGIMFISTVSTTKRYRFDLPATGSYNVRVAAGDASSPNDVKVELFDTTTSLGVLVGSNVVVTTNHYYDATNVLRTSDTDWVTNNALGGPFTFASTICRFTIGPLIAAASVIAHVWVESASGGGSVGGGLNTFNPVTESGLALAGALGSALDTLKVATETAAGKVGALSGTIDKFKPLTESAGGTVLVNVTASGIETFQHILESATGFAGAKGFATATLKHLTESATGQVSSNNAVGYGLDQFKSIKEASTGEIGTIGSILNTLNPIRAQAFGVSGAPAIQPGPSPFGGFVSYDYQTTTTEPLVPLEPEPMDVKADLPVIKQVPFTPDYKPLKQKVSAKVAKEMQTFWEQKKQDDDNAILDDDEQVVMALSRFFMENRF